jgi:cadmium resistance protein CadD (predicted permease)
MADKKVAPAKVTATTPITKKATASVSAPLFEKQNFMWMGIGAVVIAIGMLLMAGGKNENANQFDYNVVYSFRRVTIAPILILLGLLIEIYAIFKKPKAQH